MVAKDDGLEKPNLEVGASWFSFILMTYFDPVLKLGAQKPLELKDLGGIAPGDKAEGLYKKFAVTFKEERALNPDVKLWRILWMTIGYWKFYAAIGLFMLSAACQFGPVLLLSSLVEYFAGYRELKTWEVWFYVSLLFVFPMVQSILLAHSNNIMAHAGAQVRNCLINAVYRKSMVLSSSSRQAISTGRIITMFSDDTNQLRNFLFFVCNTCVAPFQIAVCLYLLYNELGSAAFVGLGFTVVTMPINAFVFGKMNQIRRERMTFTDARVKLMGEILNGIRIIKYYAWENAFIGKITKIRDQELRLLAKGGYIFNTAMSFLLLGAPYVQTVLIFSVYVLSGNQQLTASIAFTSLTLFGIMMAPFVFL